MTSACPCAPTPQRGDGSGPWAVWGGGPHGRHGAAAGSVRRGFGGQARQRRGVIPGHPGRRVECHRGGMALQRDQVIKRRHLVQFRGMDQTHEQIADLGAVQGAIKQRIVAMQDGLLERPLADVVAQRGAGYAQKQGHFLPMILHVADRLTEPRVGLHGVRLQLRGHPVVERLHPRAAFLLVQE